MAGDRLRAILYANECAELRKMARLVISSELALEQAALRIQTISKLGDVMGTIAPIVEIVDETKERLVGVIPSVSSQLNEVNYMLRSSISEMGSVGEHVRSKNSSEATKILQEANSAAGEKVRERFPRLPQNMGLEFNESRVPVALTANGGSVMITGKESLEEQVYGYIQTCGGDFNPVLCASFVGAPPKEVERTLLRLQQKGRVTIS